MVACCSPTTTPSSSQEAWCAAFTIPLAGTGGMLSTAEEYLRERSPKAHACNLRPGAECGIVRNLQSRCAASRA